MKTMFIGVIIVAIIMLVVLLIVVASQQMQINEINRQDILEFELSQCGSIVINQNPFNRQSVDQAGIDWRICFSNAIEKYGNDEQKLQWETSQLEEQRAQENRDDFVEMMTQDCRERYIGQIQEMNDCIDGIDRYNSLMSP
jgi:hypothetical protein